MQQKIFFNSAENAAFHEAGHAVTALDVGAKVVEMELYRDPLRSYGRTRVDRDQNQARHIALGGFAAEYLLYAARRLVKQDGSEPTEKEFIDHAYGNARDDFEAFWTYQAGSSDPDIVGKSQEDMDRQFMNYAIGQAKNGMAVDAVERLADTLLARVTLDEQAILAAVTP